MSDLIHFLNGYPRHYASVPRQDAPLSEKKRFLKSVHDVRKIIASLKGEIPTAIVTGTNGKGSVVSITAFLLRQSGLKVGVISSPALAADSTDMIMLNGEPIAADVLLHELRQAQTLLGDMNSAVLTHYMLLCVAAFVHFARTNVDVIIAETAVGGFYDPTVPDGPNLCAFTNFQIDHTDIFGPSLDGTCRNKCGIINPSSRVVIGPEVALPQAAIIHRYAQRKGAEIVPAPTVRLDPPPGLIYDYGPFRIMDTVDRCPDYQRPNIEIACRLAEALLGKSSPRLEIEVGTHWQGLFPPNRFEIRAKDGVTFVFDSAHNQAGYQRLRETLTIKYPRCDIHFFKGASSVDSIESFAKTFGLERTTLVSGYHPRVIDGAGFTHIDAIDFDMCARQADVIVICGIFLAPVVKERLFPNG